MIFEFTENFELVRRILTDARCWRRMVNDSAPAMEAFEVGPSPNIRHVVAYENGLALAVFVLVAMSHPQAAEVHFCILPDEWGDSKRIADGFLAWLWQKTSLMELAGPVPSYNRLAIKLAKAVGFVQSIRVDQAVIKSGKSYNLIHLEMQRPVANAQTATART